MTVIERLKERRLTMSKQQRWQLGAAARDRFIELTGRAPRKELRTKTSGAGSHCFAIYPREFEVELDALIDSYKAADDAQKKLF